jgi:type 1 glutamine amidotransferase
MNKIKFISGLILLITLFSPVISAKADDTEQFQVLLYTSPNRWHDAVTPLAVQQFEKLAKKHSFGFVWSQIKGSKSATTDPFSKEFLKKINVVVFLNATIADLSDEQLQNFKDFIHNGGGWVGIHSALGGKSEWYNKLVGRPFTEHPEIQTAVINVQDKTFPANLHLPDKWVWTEEFYTFGKPLTDSLHTLLTVDESTYNPDKTWGSGRKMAMGKFHPVSWYQKFEGGRSFYTALGHLPGAYDDPWFLQHLYGAIYWAATGLGISGGDSPRVAK